MIILTPTLSYAINNPTNKILEIKRLEHEARNAYNNSDYNANIFYGGQALALDPKNPKILTNIGNALLELGKTLIGACRELMRYTQIGF